ncbi:MAG: hypothetical protein Q8S10_10860 [Thiobacillus sp.]|nr:hypothetical protein [Thiobacillus sp.]
MKKIAVGFALSFLLAQASHAGKVLSGDEIKALVANKTITVVLSSSNQWRQYFSADGSSKRDNGENSTWYVENDKHCNTAAKLLCAAVQENGDGTYSRLKPDGGPAVTWTKIVDGKDF